MTTTEVKRRIKEYRAAAKRGDYEASAGMEQRLMSDFIKYIINDSDADGEVLSFARLISKISNDDNPRW